MNNNINNILKENGLVKVEAYQSNYDNLSLNKEYVTKQADGKSDIKQVIALVDEMDFQALQKNNDIFFNGLSFDNEKECNEYIVNEIDF